MQLSFITSFLSGAGVCFNKRANSTLCKCEKSHPCFDNIFVNIVLQNASDIYLFYIYDYNIWISGAANENYGVLNI